MFSQSSLSPIYGLVIQIITIILTTYGINFFIRRIFKKIFQKANKPKTRTVLSVVQNGVSIGIFLIAGLMILSTLNINILPILASAGIVGFTVGFGSQSLIKDLISGLFLLTGDVFYEGDVIRVNTIEGKVEKMNIRTVSIRDVDGIVHTIPNGAIGTVANLTKEWSRANINIGVSAEQPIDNILAVFNEELDKLKKDPLFGGWIIGIPRIEGIDTIEGNKIIIKTLLKTNQAKKWDMEREFKYRIKKRFENENLKFA